ncbi:MAG: hypothetical protein COY66_01760 [Candidatus Kerfeldbacteria bacterium CG_4_10_14_0_8_um_filter_42_10]|uniref:Response regulatory domain-containing protein n=1 Tax=Candidatus Kerfeldbacteria bacterium CG_4_10_14_0_8_um_filter_42_10 TaxID=2014248 RepID=A0A2M7RKD5_9BACT|nr:MAG: hypothetical protein COY66_01760 [Candidatus Kerfeldbacteria bacterium CG_4_10_14_0_8_um_filter_42_10]
MDDPKKILIVDDEASVRSAIKNAFSQKNIAILGAKSGQEGLVIAFKEHPDLIILDYVMPMFDGIDFLKKIRDDKWGKNSKIVMLTNIPSPEKKKASEALGAEFLVKAQWRLEDLVKKCEKLV